MIANEASRRLRTPGAIFVVAFLGMILLAGWQRKTIAALRAANDKLTVSNGDAQAAVKELRPIGNVEPPEGEGRLPESPDQDEDLSRDIQRPALFATNGGGNSVHSPARRKAAGSVDSSQQKSTTAASTVDMAAIWNLPQWHTDKEIGSSLVGGLGGVTVANELTKEQLLESPEWSLNEPLPISAALGEKHARRELQKFVDDADSWVLGHIFLTKEKFEDGQSRWAFAFRFYAPDYDSSKNTFGVCVSFSGTVGVTTRW